MMESCDVVDGADGVLLFKIATQHDQLWQKRWWYVNEGEQFCLFKQTNTSADGRLLQNSRLFPLVFRSSPWLVISCSQLSTHLTLYGVLGALLKMRTIGKSVWSAKAHEHEEHQHLKKFCSGFAFTQTLIKWGPMFYLLTKSQYIFLFFTHL